MSKRAPTVYAFMDESGDPGRDIRRGASRHFVLVLVETTEPDTLRDELERLRLALNLHEQFEFHYHSTRSVERRAAFFVLLRALNLKVRAAIIDKNHLPQSFSAFDTELYAFAVGELVTRRAE